VLRVACLNGDGRRVGIDVERLRHQACQFARPEPCTDRQPVKHGLFRACHAEDLATVFGRVDKPGEFLVR